MKRSSKNPVNVSPLYDEYTITVVIIFTKGRVVLLVEGVLRKVLDGKTLFRKNTGSLKVYKGEPSVRSRVC